MRTLRPALTLLALAILAVPPAGLVQAESSIAGAALPRHGDEAEYWWRGDDGPEMRLKIRWNGTERTHDAWGRAVTVDVVEVTTGGGGWFRYGLPPGGLVPIFVDQVMEDGPGGPRSVHRAHSDGLSFVQEDFCLVRAGWQGAPFERLPSMPLRDLCPKLPEGDARLVLVGEETVRGVEARRYETWVGDTVAGRTVWLAEGFPFPLAVRGCNKAPGLDCDAESIDTFGSTLVSFHRGQGPALQPASGDLGVGGRPASEFQRFDKGPADDGAGNFTLAEALDAIERDAAAEEFRQWRASHADARLWRARHMTSPRTAETVESETWDVQWTAASDGTGWLLRTSTDPSCSLTGRLPAVPAPVPTCAVLLDASTEKCGCETSPAPARSLTLGAALRRFAAEHAGDRAATPVAYGFELLPAGLGDAAQVVRIEGAYVEDGTPVVGSYNMATGALVEEQRLLLPEGRPPVTSPDEAFAPTSSTLPGPGPAPAALRWVLVVLGLGAVVALVQALRVPAMLVVLYTRLTREDVESHPRRARLVEAIQTRPGATYEDLEQMAGFGGGALRHHVEVLARSGKVSRVRSAGALHHFLVGTESPLRMRETAILAAGSAEARVLGAVRASPGVHAADLAREMGVTRVAVHYVVKGLAKKGLLREEREGRVVRLYPRTP